MDITRSREPESQREDGLSDTVPPCPMALSRRVGYCIYRTLGTVVYTVRSYAPSAGMRALLSFCVWPFAGPAPIDAADRTDLVTSSTAPFLTLTSSTETGETGRLITTPGPSARFPPTRVFLLMEAAYSQGSLCCAESPVHTGVVWQCVRESCPLQLEPINYLLIGSLLARAPRGGKLLPRTMLTSSGTQDGYILP